MLGVEEEEDEECGGRGGVVEAPGNGSAGEAAMSDSREGCGAWQTMGPMGDVG